MPEILRRRGKDPSVEATLVIGSDERVITGPPPREAIMNVGEKPTPHSHSILRTASSIMRFTNRVGIIDTRTSPSPRNSTPAPGVNAKINDTTPTPFRDFIPQKTDKKKLINQFTTTQKDDEDEEKKRKLRNSLFNDILDAIDDSLSKIIKNDLRKNIINELWEDFSSNQEYQSSITANTPGSNKQNSIPPTLHPTLAPEKYIAKLTPKTYYGVGIQTELVKEADQHFLKITQFYDDSGFKSALKSKVSPIETANKNFKITAIYCKLDDEEKFYTIDEIYTNCKNDEMAFNLKLCDIFRNPLKNDIKLKFSTEEPNSQEKELEIKKSIFKKDEHENSSYENIKTIYGSQAPDSHFSATSAKSYSSTNFVILA